MEKHYGRMSLNTILRLLWFGKTGRVITEMKDAYKKPYMILPGPSL